MNMSSDQRKQNSDVKQMRKADNLGSIVEAEDQLVSPNISDPSGTIPDEMAFEEAIRQSVTATSTGNLEEDEMIEKAIRASVAELRRASKEDNENDTIERAIQASISQAKRTQSTEDSSDRPKSGGDHDAELEEALRLSMQGYDGSVDSGQHHLHRDWDDSGVDTDDDENMKQALDNSKFSRTSPPLYDDEELQRALKQSQEDQRTRKLSDSAARSEEDIVLEYIKKQSLAEEEHRRAMAESMGHGS